jgi:hypothetical protein
MPIFAGQILHGGAKGLGIPMGALGVGALAGALLLPVGFAMMVEMGSSNTLMQTMSPDRLRGRVMSGYSMMFMGMAPPGAVVSGVTAARWGAPATVAGGSLGGEVG